MRINYIKYTDHNLNWELQRVDFNSLVLLVGASGVGKTRILSAIESLVNIAKGKSISGIEWEIEFRTINNSIYNWKGTFETIDEPAIIQEWDFDEEDTKKKAKIINEELYLNGTQIVKRDINEIIFASKKTPKLSSSESIISLLKEEELIQPVFNGFKKIVISDQSFSTRAPFRTYGIDIDEIENQYKNLDEIQEANIETIAKLYATYRHANTIFNKIKEKFIDIFPQVEDIKFEPIKNVPSWLKDEPFVHIKEIDLPNWVYQSKISSGMIRTLLHVSEIFLSSKGTVILIDEFENSLGINCIDDLTDELINSTRNLQYIITSHHPYIINRIDFKFWKLVTRKGSLVKAQDASTFNLGKSKHDAFLQLINLEQYRTGSY